MRWKNPGHIGSDLEGYLAIQDPHGTVDREQTVRRFEERPLRRFLFLRGEWSQFGGE